MSRYKAWGAGGRRLSGVWNGRSITIPHSDVPAVPYRVAPGTPVENALIVSQAGNDTTGTGTLGNPYRSFVKAAAEVAAGGTIYFRDGYYDVIGTDVYRGAISVNGTSGNPVTIGSYPGEWAIIDGINHAWHPRYENDGRTIEDPVLFDLRGQYLVMEHLELRNGVGIGLLITSRYSTFRHLVVRNTHAHCIYAGVDECVLEDIVVVDGFSVFNGGNSSNGIVMLPHTQFTNAWPGATGNANVIRRVLSTDNGDDGISTSWSRFDNIVEHCVVMRSGIDAPGGHGVGFKMGLSNLSNPPTTLTRNIFRYNIAYGNKNNGFDTNAGQGAFCHNNLALSGVARGFVLTRHNSPDSECDNTAHNNLSVSNGTQGPIVGQTGCLGDPTTHTHNAGSPYSWPNGTYGSDNMQLSTSELALMSTDPTHADFAKLGELSLARAAGTLISGGESTDTDLGPIPYDTEFAGGWDWRALMAWHPSVRRSYYSEPGGVPTQHPMPQT